MMAVSNTFFLTKFMTIFFIDFVVILRVRILFYSILLYFAIGCTYIFLHMNRCYRVCGGWNHPVSLYRTQNIKLKPKNSSRIHTLFPLSSFLSRNAPPLIHFWSNLLKMRKRAWELRSWLIEVNGGRRAIYF